MQRRIIYTLILFFLHSILFSQHNDLKKKISIQFNGETLSEAILKISKETETNFAFNPLLFEKGKLVYGKFEQTETAEVLKVIFTGLEIDILFSEKQIILKSKQQVPSESAEEKVTVSGFVKDKKSGEILIGSTIYISNYNVGTTSNQYGFFSLQIPKGEHLLICSNIGYKTYTIPFSAKNNHQLYFDLDEDTSSMQEIVISTEEPDVIKANSKGLNTQISPATILKMPGFMGDVDLIKTLEHVPGITAHLDGSSYFYVRGGNRDQNFILLDDAPIINPTHMLGFVSAFSPDAIKSINIFKSEFPSQYGGRLSSFIDIRTKDGDMQKTKGSANIGLITGNYTIEGPLKKDKSSYFLSFRRSRLSWLKIGLPELDKFYFYDINGKLNFHLNQKNRLYISFYTGKDKITYGTVNSSGISWGNSSMSIRLNHVHNEKLFSNTTVFISSYNYRLITSEQNDTYWLSEISNISIKQDYNYYLNNTHNFKLGWNAGNYGFNPGNYHLNNDEYQHLIPEIPRRKAFEFNLYGEDDIRLSSKFSINVGIRSTLWRNFGALKYYQIGDDYKITDTVYTENANYNKFFLLDPRINLKYSINNRYSAKLSYTRCHQNLHMISNITSQFTTMDIWLPSDPNIDPQRSNQYSGGVFYRSSNKKISIGSEIFFKEMFEQIDYIEHARMLFNPAIESELRFGNGISYGNEWIIKYNNSNTEGWISFCLSRSLKKVIFLNGGNYYPALYDRPIQVSAFASQKINQRWQISGTFTLASGAPFRSPTGFYEYQGYTIPIYTDMNNARLPIYHRFDISATLKLNKNMKRWNHFLNFSIYNLYARNNAMSVTYTKMVTPDGRFVVPQDMEKDYDLVVTKLSVMGVIPSISYYIEFK